MTGSDSRRPRARWLRRLLAWFGLGSDSRVHISAPGIDVVISGAPERVRSVLSVVTAALEREESERARRKRAMAPISKVVEPTELDDMDSPYAIPGVNPPVVKVRSPTTDGAPPPKPRPRAVEARDPVIFDPAEIPEEATFEIAGRRGRVPPRAPSLAIEEETGFGDGEATAVEIVQPTETAVPYLESGDTDDLVSDDTLDAPASTVKKRRR